MEHSLDQFNLAAICTEESAQNAWRFTLTSPYHGSWLSYVYGLHFRNVYGAKIIRERDFRAKLETFGERPELMFMGNFIVERAGIVALCREHGINVIHCEDGFFPHYGNAHGDPLGFSWESSLPRMIFRRCSEHQRERAITCRDGSLNFSPEPLPDSIHKPFVFWPLQLIGDKVNRWDHNAKEWCGLLRHFRSCLPKEFQLIIKPHPRGKPHDMAGVEQLVKELRRREAAMRTKFAFAFGRGGGGIDFVSSS